MPPTSPDSSSAASIARWCRWFGHDFRKRRIEGNLTSADRRARHSWIRHERCRRCGVERQVKVFDDRGYWRDVARENEDRRLEEVIRRATR